MTSNIRIFADVTGAFWWPIGEPWEKTGVIFNVTQYQRRCINGGRGARGITLREAMSGLEDDHIDDSSCGVTFAGELVVTRGAKTRAFPLEMFPSISDMVTKADTE